MGDFFLQANQLEPIQMQAFRFLRKNQVSIIHVDKLSSKINNMSLSIHCYMNGFAYVHSRCICKSGKAGADRLLPFVSVC